MKAVLRWVGAALGALVFLLLVMIAVGESLPIRHSATCMTEIAAPVDLVWKTVANPLDYSWRSDIVSVEPVEPISAVHTGGEQWIEVDHNGQSIKYQRASAQPKRHIVNRIADTSLPFGGTWTYDFSPAAHGTNVSIREDGEIYNPIFRLMARYFIGYTTTMKTHLLDLGKHFGKIPDVSCAVTEPPK